MRLRWRVRTLRTRVSLLALGVIAAWLVLLAVALGFVLVSRLDQQVASTLRVRAQAATATVIVRDGVLTGVQDPAADSELDGDIWVYSTTRAVSRPSAGDRLQRVADQLSNTPSRFVDRYDHRFYVLPVLVHGRAVGSVVTVADLDPYERTRATALGGLAVVALLLLAGAYPVLRFATGRALRPVDGMTRQAAEWSVVAPNERFGGDQRYTELASLARSLDELLARLAAALRYERHLSAELSHELRTPLARVIAQLDLLQAGADEDQQRDLDEIRANCTVMDGIIDTLMAAARTELTGTVGRASTQEVLARFTDPAGRPRVVAAAGTTPIGVDTELVARMLAPVVDNARRYARTTVELRARQRGSNVEIDVVDDGPPAVLDDSIFDPGVSTREHGHDGAGLGLALARRLARSADGELVTVPDAGRTTFRLTLPAG